MCGIVAPQRARGTRRRNRWVADGFALAAALALFSWTAAAPLFVTQTMLSIAPSGTEGEPPTAWGPREVPWATP